MGGIFAIIYIVSNGKWVGFGDAKLLFLIGLVLGYPLGFLSMIISVWIAALVGIVLMLSGKANRKTALPFGSFLAGVSILIIVFQNEITAYFFKPFLFKIVLIIAGIGILSFLKLSF